MNQAFIYIKYTTYGVYQIPVVDVVVVLPPIVAPTLIQVLVPGVAVRIIVVVEVTDVAVVVYVPTT